MTVRHPGRPRRQHLTESCVNGHPWDEFGVMQKNGFLACTICRREGQSKTRAKYSDRVSSTEPKPCSRCGSVFPAADYGRNPGYSDGLQPWCRRCRRDAGRDRKYGLGPGDYDRLTEAQNALCGICRQPESIPGVRLAVDHDHATGEVRGLLCRRCNAGIGMFEEDPQLLARAIEWIQSVRTMEYEQTRNLT